MRTTVASIPAPVVRPSTSPPKPLRLLRVRPNPLRIVACQTTPSCPETAPAEDPSKPPPAGTPEFPNEEVGRRIAAAVILGSVGLFGFSRLDFGVSLKDLTASASPSTRSFSASPFRAMSNGKPTVVEFYADWCEVCRESAPDVYKVEQQFKDRVNFVMLIVDNTNWEQELDEFGVEGIPHFAFLDKEGNEEGNVVGRIPRQFFLENVDALAKGDAGIPHSRVTGRYSSAEFRRVHQVVDHRSHG